MIGGRIYAAFVKAEREPVADGRIYNHFIFKGASYHYVMHRSDDDLTLLILGPNKAQVLPIPDVLQHPSGTWNILGVDTIVATEYSFKADVPSIHAPPQMTLKQHRVIDTDNTPFITMAELNDSIMSPITSISY